MGKNKIVYKEIRKTIKGILKIKRTEWGFKDQENFWNLDGGKTYATLEALQGAGMIPWDNGPWNVNSWESNPFSSILFDEKMWKAWVKTFPGKVTMASLARSIFICAFYLMRGRGPDGDGVPKMMRKHWYSWAKQLLQQAALLLKTCLLDNGTPDSEALNALLSSVVADWNEKGLLEYKTIYIENNTTKYDVIDSRFWLPSENYAIVVCCEKDAAYNDVLLSAMAMGARVVYSGGGKSSRTGIEKMLGDAKLLELPKYVKIVLLVISDFDTDGESIIAPTFGEQLATWIDPERIVLIRVGADPTQISAFGYNLDDKQYVVKYLVGDANNANYLEWCLRNAIFYWQCKFCGNTDPKTGITCPECGGTAPRIYFGESLYKDCVSAEDQKAWKEEVVSFLKENTPYGFELDALSREDYCWLLVAGLEKAFGEPEYEDDEDETPWEAIVKILSRNAEPQTYWIKQELTKKFLDENPDYQNALEYKQKVDEWFQIKMQEFNTLIEKAQEEAGEAADAIVDIFTSNYKDDCIYEEDPEPMPEDLAQHMIDQKYNKGRCTYCYRSIDECRDPVRHKQNGYWESPSGDELFQSVKPFQPFDENKRQELQDQKVRDLLEEDEDIYQVKEDFCEKTWDWPIIQINTEEDNNDNSE